MLGPTSRWMRSYEVRHHHHLRHAHEAYLAHLALHPSKRPDSSQEEA